MAFIHSFDPVIDDNSRVLVLGSMPGKLSLEKCEYYAHPQNLFWNLIYSTFSAQPDLAYQDKLCFLNSKKVALWDVIQECDRSGSSDSKIVNPTINDFGALLTRYPNIRYICFNGKKAESLFRRILGSITYHKILLFTLPSSSPANASISSSKKQEAWSLIKELADE
jgi:methylated-DNA-[protein]-cysteine S-methyltransferase